MSASASATRDPPINGSELLSMPLFAGLSEADARLVCEAGRIEELAAGAILMMEDDPRADSYYALLAGEVALTHDERMIGLQVAPADLSLLSMMDRQPSSASITAFSNIRVGRLPRAPFELLLHRSGRFARNVLDTLARDLRQQHDRASKLIARFDDMFVSPNARLVLGPWEMPGSELYAFTVVGPSSVMTRVLPEGLRPIGTGLGPWLLCFLTHPHFRSRRRTEVEREIQYREILPLIPVHLPVGGLGLFCPVAYPESYLGFFVGREL